MDAFAVAVLQDDTMSEEDSVIQLDRQLEIIYEEHVCDYGERKHTAREQRVPQFCAACLSDHLAVCTTRSSPS
jgi:hypothetical protein